MPGQKPSKPRALDAVVGAVIAAVVIMAATFGELGPAHHATQAAAYGTMQGSVLHQAFKAKSTHVKARCAAASVCSR